jgi:hypothetical protein
MKAQRASRGTGVRSVNLGVRWEWLVDTRTRPLHPGYLLYAQETGWSLEMVRTGLENRELLALPGVNLEPSSRQ